MFDLFACQDGVRLIPLKLGADRQKLTNTSQIRKYDFTGRPTYKTLKRTVQPGTGKVQRLLEKRGDTITEAVTSQSIAKSVHSKQSSLATVTRLLCFPECPSIVNDLVLCPLRQAFALTTNRMTRGESCRALNQEKRETLPAMGAMHVKDSGERQLREFCLATRTARRIPDGVDELA